MNDSIFKRDRFVSLVILVLTVFQYLQYIVNTRSFLLGMLSTRLTHRRALCTYFKATTLKSSGNRRYCLVPRRRTFRVARAVTNRVSKPRPSSRLTGPSCAPCRRAAQTHTRGHTCMEHSRSTKHLPTYLTSTSFLPFFSSTCFICFSFVSPIASLPFFIVMPVFIASLPPFSLQLVPCTTHIL